MSERFTIGIDGEDHELTEDNHTIAMFRLTPEYDYLHIQPEDDPVEEQRHILIFRYQTLCHWMANLALNTPDLDKLKEMKEDAGSFRKRNGFNSKVMLEDSANAFEVDSYVESMLSDLRMAEAPPEEWE